MTIHPDFAPFPALIGGMLIGFGSIGLLLFRGKVAGVSGIIKGLFQWHGSDKLWRIIFLLGMILGSKLYFLNFKNSQYDYTFDGSWSLYIVSGLLVGFGVGIGNGCTSGHGVCGISRGSPRSIASTIVFMAMAFIITFLIRG